MSYLVISAKKVIDTHRPLLGKSVKEIQDEIFLILFTSEKILAASREKDISLADIKLTQETISEIKERINICTNELYYRN